MLRSARLVAVTQRKIHRHAGMKAVPSCGYRFAFVRRIELVTLGAHVAEPSAVQRGHATMRVRSRRGSTASGPFSLWYVLRREGGELRLPWSTTFEDSLRARVRLRMGILEVRLRQARKHLPSRLSSEAPDMGEQTPCRAATTHKKSRLEVQLLLSCAGLRAMALMSLAPRSVPGAGSPAARIVDEADVDGLFPVKRQRAEDHSRAPAVSLMMRADTASLPRSGRRRRARGWPSTAFLRALTVALQAEVVPAPPCTRP